MFSPILRPSFENLSLLYHNKYVITVLQRWWQSFILLLLSLQKHMQRCRSQVHTAISICSNSEWKTCHFSNLWLFCPSSFSDFEKSLYRREAQSQYRGHPGGTHRKRSEQASFQQPTTTRLFLKSQTWQRYYHTCCWKKSKDFKYTMVFLGLQIKIFQNKTNNSWHYS